MLTGVAQILSMTPRSCRRSQAYLEVAMDEASFVQEQQAIANILGDCPSRRQRSTTIRVQQVQRG